MAAWARKVAMDPNATTPADIQALRDSGLDDGQIFAITAVAALRLAFLYDQRLARRSARRTA
jgi:alkylhydroperoxidase family enzyme